MNISRNTIRAIGVILIVVVSVIVVLALMGPAISNVFQSVVDAGPMPSYGIAGGESGGPITDMDESSPAGLASPAYERPKTTASDERLIVREGDITLVIEDTRAARETIEGIVAGMSVEGAYVVSSNEWGGTVDRHPAISMTIRVPVGQFDAVMDRLAEMAFQVSGRSETAQDVTEEYIDLQNRIESMEVARDRLLEIMAGAGTTRELLDIEKQLTQREADIEALKGRLQYLRETALLSKISITINPYVLSQPVEYGWRPAETARKAYETLLDRLQTLLDSLINFSIATLPFWIIAGAVIYLGWRIFLRYYRKDGTPEADNSSIDE